jgi:hypothetical protein
MKKLALLFTLSFFALFFQPITHAEVIDKNKPAYVWFSKCVDDKDLDCIESLGIIDKEGSFIPGKPTGYSRPSNNTGSVEAKKGGFLNYTWTHPNETWELPGLASEYGNSYVTTEFSLVTGAGSWYDPVSNTVFPPSGINSMRFALLAVPTIQGFEGGRWGIPLKNFAHNCVTQDFAQKMECQRTANFSTDQKIQATLRFSWYRASKVQSNLRENTYVVEELGNGATRVTVSGKPMERPYFVDSPTLSRDVYTREQADTSTNQWEIQTTDSSDGYTPDKCKNTGLPIATGNMYSQTPPSWNAATGDLSVNVWAPHLDPSGEVYKGYYEGNFTKEYISCLWGISANKISDEFSVSITDLGTGASQVATTSIVQTNTGVRLVASGFHYSKGEIKFLRRAASNAQTPIATPTPKPVPVVTETPIPTPTAIAKATVAKKITITCVKGKSVRKVTAVKPLCPVGFKKK